MLKFTANKTTYTAIGQYGTHYTYTKEVDDNDKPYYYTNDTNMEFDTHGEVIAYFEAMEAAEVAINKCHTLGVRAFEVGFADECDIRHTKVDQIQYVFCPDHESAKAFIEFTEHCVDCYFLGHTTEHTGLSNTMRHLFEYKEQRDSFERCDDTICAVISQLVK